MNFNAVIDPEIEIEQLVQVPAKTVLFNGRYDAQQAGVFKKFFKHGLIVNPQFHFYLFKNYIEI